MIYIELLLSDIALNLKKHKELKEYIAFSKKLEKMYSNVSFLKQ